MKTLIKKLLRENFNSPFRGRNLIYHSSHIDAVMNMLSINKIEARTTQTIKTKFNKEDRKYTGVSFTRNKDVVFGDAQLILDGDLIKRDYGNKLIPYDYYGGKAPSKSSVTRNNYVESEEFLIGPLNGLSKYILGIRDSTDNSKIGSNMIEYLKTHEPDIFNEFKASIGDIPFFDNKFNRIEL